MGKDVIKDRGKQTRGGLLECYDSSEVKVTQLFTQSLSSFHEKGTADLTITCINSVCVGLNETLN